jgi:hypothetical protein
MEHPVMSDRELMELAAKAAGLPIVWARNADPYALLRGDLWDPLEDDGDALRLAMKLRINIYNPPEGYASASYYAAEIDRVVYVNESGRDDAATRRAIVRAAAEICTGHDPDACQ